MPRSAIATGQVDMVLQSGDMPVQLLRIERSGPAPGLGEEVPLPESPDHQTLLRQIFGRLRGTTGHDFSGYKHSTILRRLDRRLRFNDLQTLPDYLRLLQQSPDEVWVLFQDLLIS